MLASINPFPGKAFNSFNPGWQGFMESDPISLAEFISFAEAESTSGPSITYDGTFMKSSVFNSPSLGTWNSSPISITSSPTINSIGTLQSNVDVQNLIASQTAFMGTNVPPPLQNFLFLQTNKGCEQKFSMTIPIDLGGGSFDVFQISALENSVNQGDKNGQIQVIDFGSGPFSGTFDLHLCFNAGSGPFNIGIRLENNLNQSSMFAIRGFLLPLC